MTNRWHPELLAGRVNARTGVRLEDVFLQSVGEQQWRVIDRARPVGGVCALLGFVARRDGVYEAMVLTLPGSVTRHPDQDSARRRFRDPHLEDIEAFRGWNAA